MIRTVTALISAQVMTTTTKALIAFLLAFLLAGTAMAHPEDEFCRGMDGMDPALCAALAEIDSSEPLSSAAKELEGRSSWEVFTLYIGAGVQHILPGGLDHILFVLALFLAARSMSSLILQISAFTLAHTVTLGIATAGWVNLPSEIVEPLIAFSIAVMALANLFPREDKTRWRILLIFAFGLLHGLGFAGFLSSLGLPDGQAFPALIGFNIGVELGQLSVVAIAAIFAFGLKRTVLKREDIYWRVIPLPASLAIATIGLWWTIERVV